MRFSEAEVQQLFPAPLTRTQLLHYKLLHTLLLSVVSAMLTALIFGRGFFGHSFFWGLGSAIAFATLSFHGIAASFTRSTLFEHGMSGLRRQVVTLFVIGLFIAVVVHGVRAHGGDLGAAMRAPPLAWVLLPIRVPARLMVAPDLGSFLGDLPIALGSLLLHYVWVVSSAVRFEDASLEAAEKRARWVEARRGMRGALVLRMGTRAAPFRRGGGVPGDGGGAGGDGYLLSVAYGPLICRFDLRLDVQNLEQLRALPLSGRQIFLGEVLAPAAFLAVAQWLFLALTVALGGLPEIPVATSEKAASVAGAAIAGPAMSLLGVAIQNAVVVVFPDWNRTPVERSRGPELIGMQLMILMANFLALALLVLPGAALGAGLMFVLWDRMGAHSAPLAAALVAVTRLGEVIALSVVFGRAFDKLEVTT